MFVVMTKVKLHEGTSAQCAELFRQTNPDLVKNEKDWLGAQMIFDRDANTITVLARWKDARSYQTMRTGAKFQDIMQEFGKFFASTPEVTTNEVLVDMVPENSNSATGSA